MTSCGAAEEGVAAWLGAVGVAGRGSLLPTQQPALLRWPAAFRVSPNWPWPKQHPQLTDCIWALLELRPQKANLHFLQCLFSVTVSWAHSTMFFGRWNRYHLETQDMRSAPACPESSPPAAEVDPAPVCCSWDSQCRERLRTTAAAPGFPNAWALRGRKAQHAPLPLGCEVPHYFSWLLPSLLLPRQPLVRHPSATAWARGSPPAWAILTTLGDTVGRLREGSLLLPSPPRGKSCGSPEPVIPHRDTKSWSMWSNNKAQRNHPERVSHLIFDSLLLKRQKLTYH